MRSNQHRFDKTEDDQFRTHKQKTIIRLTRSRSEKKNNARLAAKVPFQKVPCHFSLNQRRAQQQFHETHSFTIISISIDSDLCINFAVNYRKLSSLSHFEFEQANTIEMHVTTNRLNLLLIKMQFESSPSTERIACRQPHTRSRSLSLVIFALLSN